MQLGMIGLGRMGANMVRRLLRGGHACVVHSLSASEVQPLVADGDPLDHGAAAISPDRLQPVVTEAAARWSAAGLTPASAAST